MHSVGLLARGFRTLGLPAGAWALLAAGALWCDRPAQASADSKAPTTSSKPADKDDEDDAEAMKPETFAGLKLRCIGPAFMAGRIGDFAVHPTDHHHYYVAVASGGVWKTVNGGATYTPVFDGEKSFSIGCLAMDPKNPSVVWVGTGENNSQRSVAFGDGIYRTRNGGASWENLGLKESEHIGKIVIDPRDSNTVYVAAQGPLWRSGGDRGLYKTTDGGLTWQRILHVSDDTGVNEVHMDPRDPNVLIASAYQRRRHVWTLINGGPESAIYKSTDAGKTWRKITQGIPEQDKGRIGLAISPANPDTIYAIIEAAEGKGGVFRSTDRGETWDKRSSYMSSSPQYYNELVADPRDPDRVYALDTFLNVTEDGGKNFRRVPGAHRHVDDHALWIEPESPSHLLVGSDGGIYESFDAGANWMYKPNLPITQFYRVTVDNSTPFYFVYGGTQDNNTVGGPSRTKSPVGIVNEDWFVTVGGDGFKTQVDPEDPNIVYSQWQHGGLVRFDRQSGEEIDIKPVEPPGEPPYKWNWDSPLIISPHNRKRLYFGCQKLLRSDDQGDSWTIISGDLTRGIDRNQLKVMGRIQNADAVAKHRSTSIYGNTVSLTESPLVEGLLYVGSDDGLIHVTEDGGKTWRKESVFPGIPDKTYVSCLFASQHDKDTVYAAFDNHKMGDFKPYVLKSTDRGQNWTSIAGDLPERDIVYSIVEDHEKPSLHFVGTEFGVYFTPNGGEKWLRLKGGIPTIAVRDVVIQKRENDLALATFGRGFYILDDYSPLRQIDADLLKKDSHLFDVKPALRYVQTGRMGNWAGKGTQGASYYAANNPPFGATFTYFLKEKLMSRKERRKEAEKKAEKANKPYKHPTLEQLRAEDDEKEPQILLIVKDDAGETIRRITASRDKGLHRATWDLRYPPETPVRLTAGEERDPWDPGPVGPMALPGKYTVTLAKEVDGELTELAEPKSFEVVPLDLGGFKPTDRDEVMGFYKKVAKLNRAVQGAVRVAGEAQSRLAHLRKAAVDTPGADKSALAEVRALDARLTKLTIKLSGDSTLSRREEPTPTSIRERVSGIVGSQWRNTMAPTKSQRESYRFAGDEFAEVLSDLRKLVKEDLPKLEDKLEAAGAPWTPGRVPDWEKE